MKNYGTRVFLELTELQRKKFVHRNIGFLKEATLAMEADGLRNEHGKPFTRATVTRTWHGDFRAPNPLIVAALEVHYRRVLERDYKRSFRLKRKAA